jgi:hypothetical protein
MSFENDQNLLLLFAYKKYHKKNDTFNFLD